MSYFEKCAVTTQDSPAIDAFGRWRVSQPETVFDSKQLHDAAPLFFDDQEVSGASTTSSHSAATASTTIGVALNTAGKRVRQTFMRFNYQPGKSQLILLTGTLGETGGGTGITRAMGLFDDDNGIFMQDNEGTVEAVIRSSTSGSAVDTAVTQANWNLDTMDGTGPSGVTLDATKSQIVAIDFEWLGVGRVRIGFVVDGLFIYVHEFLHANRSAGVYMSTPNLPIRYEIENDGTGAASSLEHICCSVMSEGGLQDNGLLQYESTGGTHVDCNVDGTIYAIMGGRLKSTHLDSSIKLVEATVAEVQGSNSYEWLLLAGATVAGTFTYADKANSAVQIAKGVPANTVTGGTVIAGGFASSANKGGSSGAALSNAILLGSAIDGTPQEFVFAIRPISSSNLDIEASMTWRELL